MFQKFIGHWGSIWGSSGVTAPSEDFSPTQPRPPPAPFILAEYIFNIKTTDVFQLLAKFSITSSIQALPKTKKRKAIPTSPSFQFIEVQAKSKWAYQPKTKRLTQQPHKHRPLPKSENKLKITPLLLPIKATYNPPNNPPKSQLNINKGITSNDNQSTNIKTNTNLKSTANNKSLGHKYMHLRLCI
jgi:hypothetical protein